jgi:hypothetical protein
MNHSKGNVISSILKVIDYTRGYKLILFVLLVLVPIYPSLFVFVYANNQYEFSRDDIDESSILGSYFSNDD